MIKTIIQLIALSTFLIDIFFFVVLIAFISEKLFRKKYFTKIKKVLAPYSLLIAFLVALTATLGSLFLSEIANLQPCILCWWQRALLYPQTIILFMLIIKKWRKPIPYLLAINFFGLLLAIYNYFLQLSHSPFSPCRINNLISCSHVYHYYYGYITIPIMSLTAFLLIISFLFLNHK